MAYCISHRHTQKSRWLNWYLNAKMGSRNGGVTKTSARFFRVRRTVGLWDSCAATQVRPSSATGLQPSRLCDLALWFTGSMCSIKLRIVANQVTGCWHIIRLHVLTRKLNEQLWSTTLLLRLHRSHWRNVRMKDRKFRFLGVLGVSGVSATLGEKNVFSWLGLFSNVYTD